MGRITAHSLSSEETRKIAKDWAASLKPGEIVFFYGDLGAGKTTFISSLVEELTGQDQASSPTFSYVHLYEGKVPVVHFHLYRLNGQQEFFSRGLDEIIVPTAVTCIEWSERLDSFRQMPAWHVALTRDGENVRLIEITYES